jgi:CheY-like chemotaxis protein
MENLKIMVVEDEGIIAQNLKNILTNLGYTVPAIATTGPEAIRMAEITFPDLILMDVMLKGDMNGVEAAEEILKHSDVPIIYVTAYSNNEILEKAKVTRPYGYIVKPFKSEELRVNIEMAIHKHSMDAIKKNNS